MALIANFSATNRQGYTPVTVAFSIDCIGTPTYVRWEFGDGTYVEDDNNPSHTYETEGIYHVKLRIEDADGNYDELIKRNFVVVNPVQILSEDIILEGYDDSGNYYKFYVESTKHLTFISGTTAYRSLNPTMSYGIWTLVEFHAGSNEIYVGVVGTGRRRISVTTNSVSIMGIPSENRVFLAKNSSMKIDEVRMVAREENLQSYFSSMQSKVYYLPE